MRRARTITSPRGSRTFATWSAALRRELQHMRLERRAARAFCLSSVATVRSYLLTRVYNTVGLGNMLFCDTARYLSVT